MEKVVHLFGEPRQGPLHFDRAAQHAHETPTARGNFNPWIIRFRENKIFVVLQVTVASRIRLSNNTVSLARRATSGRSGYGTQTKRSSWKVSGLGGVPKSAKKS